MKKEKFLIELQEIVKDKIFVGNGPEDLEQEISHNCWSISISQQLADDLTMEELREFICAVIRNRTDQIMRSSARNGMLFYLWFDWLSGTLRFNLISDFHKQLPFNSKVETSDNMDFVINEFLTYPLHDGIPFQEITDEDVGNEEDVEIRPLRVFLYRIVSEK